MHKSVLLSADVIKFLDENKAEKQSYDSFLRSKLGLAPHKPQKPKLEDDLDYHALCAMNPGQEHIILFIRDANHPAEAALNAGRIQRLIFRFVRNTGAAIIQGTNPRGVVVYLRKEDNGVPVNTQFPLLQPS